VVLVVKLKFAVMRACLITVVFSGIGGIYKYSKVCQSNTL